VVLPLWRTVAQAFPAFEPRVQTMLANHERWGQLMKSRKPSFVAASTKPLRRASLAVVAISALVEHGPTASAPSTSRGTSWDPGRRGSVDAHATAAAPSSSTPAPREPSPKTPSPEYIRFRRKSF
jgi:hypothetical protein